MVIIAGIHTGIGKTLCSAILCQAWGYDYWKPVQAGDLAHSDSVFIKNNVSNPLCTIHPEAYQLQMAASPHFAADTEGVIIEREKMNLPYTHNNIIVETAGGIMSPLGKNFLIIDLIQHLKLPVILVSENYLGSINHTLMSIYALKQHNIPIKGIIFNGQVVPSSVDFIVENTQLPHLFSVPKMEEVNQESIKKFVEDNDIIRKR